MGDHQLFLSEKIVPEIKLVSFLFVVGAVVVGLPISVLQCSPVDHDQLSFHMSRPRTTDEGPDIVPLFMHITSWESRLLYLDTQGYISSKSPDTLQIGHPQNHEKIYT